MQYRIGQFLLWSGFLFSSGAITAISEPTFSPSTPQAGQAVTMVLQSDFCTSLTDAPDEIDVFVQGSRIDVVIDAVHSVYSPCAGSPGTHTFRLGQFPAGQYLVHVSLRDAYPPEIFPSMRLASLKVGPPAKRVVSPATTPAVLALLGVMIVIAACRHGDYPGTQ